MRWVNWAPNKINCFIWRFLKNRLSTTDNLSKRGVTIRDPRCVFYMEFDERLNHVFFDCSMAKTIWSLVNSWCNLIPVDAKTGEEFMKALSDFTVGKKRKLLAFAIAYSPCGRF